MQTIDLGGMWELRQGGQDEAIPATVPGCVHTDLLAAGRIEDPFFRDNENRLQWIGHTDWAYAREFNVPEAFLRSQRVALRCEGLDTLAEIRLNGRKLAAANNMYRTWEFDVAPLLRPGANRIEVRFRSAEREGARLQKAHPVPGLDKRVEVQGKNWLRKEPCNFGWDWGPKLVTCGIWRDIALVAFDTARVTDVHIRQQHGKGKAVTLNLAAAVEAVASGAKLTAAVRVTLDGTPVAEAAAPVRRNGASCELTVKQPQLWWPNGWGEQPLYEVTVDLLDAAGNRVDTVTKRIGLRSMRLVREKDQWGESFYFEVNGKACFAKGANWIPADAFATRMTRDRYAHLIRSAADANMNMLRVWGGGIYEDDAFYDLCDEMGVLVWQDFMFACNAYPTFNEAWMDSVAAEAVDNVRRLRHHPCIAFWCGNNELEQCNVGPEWTAWKMSWSAYTPLADTLLGDVVQREDPDRAYWPSSPHSPCGDRADFNNPTCGDAHLWNVWHGKKPFEWYRTCEHRFNSEFGFQSFPEPKTVRDYTEPQDRNVTSYVMEHHQRSGIGNVTIMQYMLDWFRLPGDFDSTLWLSQILHGMAMKYAVEHWRRSKPRGMGTLYWQLNDCWGVASWASIDYYGRWKATHYLARHFNAPLLLSAVEDPAKGTVELHVTSDRLTPAKGTIRWTLTDLDGNTAASDTAAVTIPANRSKRALRIELDEPLKAAGNREWILWCELEVDGTVVSRNLATFARPKHLDLRDPEIDAKVKDNKDGSFAVTLTAKKPALWAWCELANTDAEYSDNFVHLRPGDPQTLRVTPIKPLTREQFEKQLKVSSLVDTY